MEPLTINGGTISGYPSKSYAQDIGSLYAKELTVVIQEARDTNNKGNHGHKNASEKRTQKKKKKNKCNAKHGDQ